MYYPSYRMRRLRRTPAIRDLVRETTLQLDDLVYPYFVMAGENIKNPIGSMPGVFQLSIGNLIPEVREVVRLGIKAILLFGIPAHKDPAASGAYDSEGIVQMAVRAIKDEFPELVVITDVCLCEYTDHGHCGVVQEGEVLNDVTLELLSKMAVTHADSGADIVAPSDMMDGRVAAIRNALDEEGLTDTVPHVLLQQVRLGLLRPVPRSRRLRSVVRRPQDVPDGPGQPRGGGARVAARRRGRRRHDYGEAGDARILDVIHAVKRRPSSLSPPTT